MIRNYFRRWQCSRIDTYCPHRCHFSWPNNVVRVTQFCRASTPTVNWYRCTSASIEVARCMWISTPICYRRWESFCNQQIHFVPRYIHVWVTSNRWPHTFYPKSKFEHHCVHPQWPTVCSCTFHCIRALVSPSLLPNAHSPVPIWWSVLARQFYPSFDWWCSAILWLCVQRSLLSSFGWFSLVLRYGRIGVCRSRCPLSLALHPATSVCWTMNQRPVH